MMTIPRMEGLASPGPNAYDTLYVHDRRGRNPTLDAARQRPTPAWGPPRGASIIHYRHREDEIRYHSRRMAVAREPMGPGPGMFMAPSTFIATAKVIHSRRPVQKHLPRSNPPAPPSPPSRSTPYLADAPPELLQRPVAAYPPSASVQPIIGSERPRIRPASANRARQYSSYGLEQGVASNAFRRPLSASATPSWDLSTQEGVARRQPPRPQSARLSSVRDRHVRPAWPQSAGRVVHRCAPLENCTTTGVKFDPPGRAPPLRSAFIQPYGPNRLGQ